MRMLSLCTGIGGFDLAASWLGIEVAGQVEIDPFCIRVLEKHWPEVPRMLNVFDVKGDEFGPIDLVCAGFPCQPFSHAGKRLGGADERAIWPEIARIVAAARPRWCLMENVPGLITIPTMGLDDVLADLECLGYACRAVVVPACAVGAPHRRDRVWILANDQRSTRGVGSNASGSDCGEGAGSDGWPKSGGGGSVSPLAHAEDGGVRRGGAPGQAGLAPLRGEAPADADGSGCEARDGERTEPARLRASDADGARRRTHVNGREALGGVGYQDDELSRRMVGRGVAVPFGPGWEDGVPRTTDHEPLRAAKLKALGNAVIPEVAYQLLATMFTEEST